MAGRRLSRSAKASLRSSAEGKQRKTAPLARSHVVHRDGATHASRVSLIWHTSPGARTWPVQCARLVHLKIGGRNNNQCFLAFADCFWRDGRNACLALFCRSLLPFSPCRQRFSPSRHPGFLLSVLHLYTLTVPPGRPSRSLPNGEKGVEMFASRLRGFFLFRSCSRFSNFTLPL